MTTDEKFDLILDRLTKIEKRLDAVPDTIEMLSMSAQTSGDDDIHELMASVDAIYDLIEQQDQRDALRDIRTSLRDRRVS